MERKILLLVLLLVIYKISFQQENANIIGNVSFSVQFYNKDSTIQAETPNERILSNTYANIFYYYKNFTAGIRYEGYFNTLLGYDKKNDGHGISYRFAQYKNDYLDITIGNYYEQFGNGLIFRTYEDKNIGYDNAMEGLRLKLNLIKGITIKTIIGKQRYAFARNYSGFSNTQYKGLLRGLDLELNLNECFKSLDSNNLNLSQGFSFISKYQDKQLVTITLNDTNYSLKIPQNVAAFAYRFYFGFSNYSFNVEYAYKFNDPNADNNYIYKNGHAFFANMNMYGKYFGLNLMYKYIDNFSFKSDRNATLQDLNINYIPDITKNYVQTLLAFYPYANQLNGETGISAELSVRIPKKTLFGGKYGTILKMNYSRLHAIRIAKLSDNIPLFEKGTLGYISFIFEPSKKLYYQDFSFYFEKKFTKSFQFNVIYQNLIYDYTQIRGEYEIGTVFANIIASEFLFKINSKNSLKYELQYLKTSNDQRDWIMTSLEYNLSPHYFIAIQDLYNIGNISRKIHYPMISAGYKYKSTRLSISYGKQREGVVCVGGVCRVVPATNGLLFTLNTNF